MEAGGRIVSWNITSRCNYACSYCAQGRQHHTEPGAGTVDAVTGFLCGLGPGWEVKLSGGEPFMEPGLTAAVARFRLAGLFISIVTNLSFPKSSYSKFFAAAGDMVRTVSVSLHLEYAAPRKFLDRCLWLKEELSAHPDGRLVVNTVLIPGRVSEILTLGRSFQVRGLSFYPQLKRVKGKPVPYSAEETRTLETYIAQSGSPKALNAAPSLKGTICGAGMDYFIVTDAGDCFTCYPGKRDGTGYLGSIRTGHAHAVPVSLRKKPRPCPYETCPCSVPRNRGIV